MFHLTMETPTDHPYNSGRVDNILMVQLTMVSWGFFHITALKTGQVESILMSRLIMETPTDHPNHSGRVDYNLMVQLTMVSWGFFHNMALKTVSHHVESILMSHPTMENPTSHLHNLRRVDYILMLQLTMVSWSFFSFFGFKNSI